ncbi:MAG TPA: DUF192 domain-containing protein [Thermoanaerobaculia bacterium]|jgi:uncharacterized membrane protein (UPF0127 family)|nr:DUF192 domain-containing protein [Thermoanaerobaculia bacterium]
MKPALVMLLLFACTNPSPPPGTESVATSAPVPSGPRVIFPDGFTVQVEIATDEETRAQGLMYRDHLRPGTGMLFFFPVEGEYAFWMKNTIIPLDMIFIDANKRIVRIHHDVPPCKIADCPSYPANAKSLYVLEVSGGVARQHGLKEGDVLRFEELGNIVGR